ncbi:MAG: lysylphosphatidylglycerol synthase transmembrane domain-containing protein [Bacteroidota bacterium]
MSKRLKQLLKLVLSIGLSAFLLNLVFKDVDWDEFWGKAETLNYAWIVVSVLLSVIAYFARAFRWNIMLKPLGYDLKTSRTTLAVLVGYLANLAIPRLGEVVRCSVLYRNDKVPVPVAFGTVFVDRFVDLIFLFLLMGLSFLVEAERLTEFLSTAYQDLNVPSWVIWAGLFLVIAGIIVLVLFIKNQHRLKGRFAELIKGFVSGIVSLKDIQNPVGFFVSTLVIWVVYFLMSYVIVFSLPETADLGLGAGLMLLITGGIALSLPVQSGFGTYHGMVAGMLLLYGVDHNTGIFLATVLHTSQIVTIALFGTIALIISFLIRRKNNDDSVTA